MRILEDEQWTSSGRAVDEQWTSSVRAVDEQWTSSGRAVDEQWTSSGRAVDEQWTSSGRAVEICEQRGGECSSRDVLSLLHSFLVPAPELSLALSFIIQFGARILNARVSQCPIYPHF